MQTLFLFGDNIGSTSSSNSKIQNWHQAHSTQKLHKHNLKRVKFYSDAPRLTVLVHPNHLKLKTNICIQTKRSLKIFQTRLEIEEIQITTRNRGFTDRTETGVKRPPDTIGHY